MNIHNRPTYMNEIDNIGKKLFGKLYRGTFMINRGLKLSNYECCIYNNLDSSSEGEHWFCVYKNNNRIYYYDSFGRPLREFVDKKYIRKNWTPIGLHTKEQSDTSMICGQLSLCFLLYAYMVNMDKTELEKVF